MRTMKTTKTRALATVNHAPLVTAPARDWTGIMGAWLEEVKQRTGSDRTPTEYGRHVARFLAMSSLTADPTKATAAAVHAFGYAASGGRWGGDTSRPSPSTVVVRLASVRSLFDFLRRMGIVQANPCDDVKRPRATAATPHGLDKEEVGRLLAAVPFTPSGLRDRAIILTMLLTGMRRSEVMGLRKHDLTRNGHVSVSWRAKGGKVRSRELPRPAFDAIVTACEANDRPLDSLPETAPLFNVTASGFYANLGRYAKKAGLGAVKPHDLRHTCAKLRRATGSTIEDVQEALGHESIATTARYLKRMEGEADNGWAPVAAALGLIE